MKRRIGIVLLCLMVLTLLIKQFLVKSIDAELQNRLAFAVLLSGILGTALLIPFHLLRLMIYDNEEYKPNDSIKKMVEKIRYRALLFNNISVIIFFFTLIVIIAGFWLLVSPPKIEPGLGDSLANSLTVRIGASVLLIFLVQILFRVFKYLLRVAAFYNAKADAIEFSQLKEQPGLEKLMELFTPDKYDISDLQETAPTDSLIEIIKAKLSGKG